MDLLSDTTGRKASVTGKDSGALLPSEKVAPHLSASQEIVYKGKSSGTRWMLYYVICVSLCLDMKKSVKCL